MFQFDPSQERVLRFDPTRHARVLGAPGSGKSAVLAEVYARFLDRSAASAAGVLALAPNRLAAASLRGSIEARARHALGGTPVRTPASLAFAVLAQAAAVAGEPAPRLLTGTVQDEAIAAVVERESGLAGSGMRGLPSGADGASGLAPEVMRSPVFRAELREFWRVLDDFDLEPGQLLARLVALRGRAAGEAVTETPDDELLGRWTEALGLLSAVAARLVAERPAELSSSALLRAACRALRDGCAVPPQLLLVDDAQELGEGQLALLAACASVGSSIWVFGDPDTATAAFRGERTLVLGDLAGELARRGVDVEPEQAATLEVVHRHGAELRGFLREITARIGSAGGASQRMAEADPGLPGGSVRFATAGSPSEQLGVIAHRLRSARLGLDGSDPIVWRSMAVICRSRSEAARVARGLAAHQVPTGVSAGGIVLREHRIVRDLIRLLQHALDVGDLDARSVSELLSGPVCGLDPVAVRRLRGALMLKERRAARDEERAARSTDELVLDAFIDPGIEPAIDSRGGRALRRLGRIAAAGRADAAAGGTPREVLWALWSGAGLADDWQEEALTGRGHRADEANRSLDAVTGLFFALQRHEEQASERPIGQLLEELLENSVPEDSLAQRAGRDAVTVTTPQGAVGREFEIVAIVGVQDGSWPNTRARGSLLGTVALERWMRGGDPSTPSRRDTIHDELRLFVQACSRAGGELLVVAISDEDAHPGPFFRFGETRLCEGLPSSRLTLRGATAAMRRRLVADPADREALATLAELARSEVPGAHPDEWYGVLPVSSDKPLHDLADPAQRVPVSPSQLERAESCPLDWVIGTLSGGAGSIEMNLGTLVHHAFETAQHPDPDEMLEAIMREWRKLDFEAEWESERARGTAEAMATGLAAYLGEFAVSDRELVGREAGFSVPLGRAELRGKADRLEGRSTGHGKEISVLDLKTGANPPTGPETEQHAQLQAYQLAVALGAFDGARAGTGETGAEETGPESGAARNGGEERDDAASAELAVMGGARLLYVHPKATKGRGFIERAQPPLSDEMREAFTQRVAEIAEVMAAGSFTARVEHHCSDPHKPGECRIHIIRAVSHS